MPVHHPSSRGSPGNRRPGDGACATADVVAFPTGKVSTGELVRAMAGRAVSESSLVGIGRWPGPPDGLEVSRSRSPRRWPEPEIAGMTFKVGRAKWWASPG